MSRIGDFFARLLGGPEDAGRRRARRRRSAEPWGWITVLGLLLVALVLALGYVLFEIWPAVRAEASVTATEVEFFGDGPTLHLSPDGALLALALLAGALGSLLHATISFADYVGNRTFRARWFWWYVMRAPTGALLALIFYVAVRGGFLTTGDSSENVNEFGVAAFSALAGLFAKQALDRLEQVFNVLFGSKDYTRADSLANPAPVIAEIDPESFPRQHAQVLVIRGTGFTERSKVRVAKVAEEEGMILAGTLVYVDSDELRVTVHEHAITEPGLLYVTVANPEPGGGVSGPYPVDVTDGDGGEGEREPDVVSEPPGAQAIEAEVEEVADPGETVEETAESAELADGEPDPGPEAGDDQARQ